MPKTSQICRDCESHPRDTLPYSAPLSPPAAVSFARPVAVSLGGSDAAFLLPWHAWQIRMQLFIEKCQRRRRQLELTRLDSPVPMNEWMSANGCTGVNGRVSGAGAVVTSVAPLFGQFNYAISSKKERRKMRWPLIISVSIYVPSVRRCQCK